jgi:hypothetical protein
MNRLTLLIIVLFQLFILGCSHQKMKSMGKGEQGLRILSSDVEVFLGVPMESPLVPGWTSQKLEAESFNLHGVEYERKKGSLPQGSPAEFVIDKKRRLLQKRLYGGNSRAESWASLKRNYLSGYRLDNLDSPCKNDREKTFVNVKEGVFARVGASGELIELSISTEVFFEELLKANAYKKCDF